MSLNVRLSAEEARMAAALREVGVQISSLVREAIRTEYERRVERLVAHRGSDVIREILQALPDPPGLPPRVVTTTDRRAVQRHIVARLKRRRSDGTRVPLFGKQT
jgi:hypothetical protein